jgi:hypothetical protein
MVACRFWFLCLGAFTLGFAKTDEINKITINK